MGFRSNQPTSGRDFYFSPSGNNILSGTSDENPVADPNQAITLVNALIPTPDASNPASINASVSGTYSSGVSIPEFVTCKASSASILTFDPVAVQCMGRHEVEWGSLLNFAEDGIGVLIDGETRVAVEVNAMVPIGLNGVGFEVKGACNEVFVQMRLGELQGEGSTMFKHSATNDVPIGYNIRAAESFGINQTMFIMDSPSLADQVDLTISTAQTDPSSVTTGSKIFDVRGGRLIATAQVLEAECIATVADGAELSLNSQIAIGDITLETGSASLINIGLFVGDLVVESGALLSCVINRHIGTVINNGTINGGIDTVGTTDSIRYGTWAVTYQQLLNAPDFTTQNPVGTDTPYQVLFGGAQAGSVASLDASGNITIHVDGQYKVSLRLQFGRAGTGGVAFMFFRLLVDGVQFGDSVFSKIDGTNDDLPLTFNGELDLVENEVITVEIVRDSAGMNDGGLYTAANAAGWNNAPSAKLILSRLL